MTSAIVSSNNLNISLLLNNLLRNNSDINCPTSVPYIILIIYIIVVSIFLIREAIDLFFKNK
jgi:ABC-type methionine transport system permease subunit